MALPQASILWNVSRLTLGMRTWEHWPSIVELEPLDEQRLGEGAVVTKLWPVGPGRHGGELDEVPRTHVLVCLTFGNAPGRTVRATLEVPTLHPAAMVSTCRVTHPSPSSHYGILELPGTTELTTGFFFKNNLYIYI